MTLPAYASAIRRARLAGQHPACIRIVYANTWCARDYPGAVLVLSREFMAGEYDAFSWCAGVPVLLVNHDRPWAEFSHLVAAVARWTAPVYVDGIDGGVADASYFFYALRWPKPEQEWPDAWSAHQAREYAQRDLRYSVRVQGAA